MLFNSYSFLVLFLPIVLIGFFVFSYFQSAKMAKSWLLISSLFFYSSWDIRFLPILLISILFNYIWGKKILVSKKQFYLLFGIGINIAVLFFFKYAHFFLSIFGFSFFVPVLPLGISFFTFTQIAYLIDIYQSKTETYDFLSYSLFVTIFPHLIAGPILHHKEMIEQFNHSKLLSVNWENISQGIFLFVIGLAKKVLIADALAPIVKSIFDGHIEAIPFIEAWVGALSFTFQLYFDFSGYSDMAVGLALFFNLYLPINFNSPYQADSIIDFWKRWHITLSNFLRKYLYIPLGGNRHGELGKYRNLMITMIVGGLWHGAGWTFILWGFCHGVFLSFNHLWRKYGFPLPIGFCHLITVLAVVFSWVIFRAPTIAEASNILVGMAGFHGVVLPEKYLQILPFLQNYGVNFVKLKIPLFGRFELFQIFCLILFSLCLPNSNFWQIKFKKRPLLWTLPCLGLLFLIFFQLGELSEFIYTQF